MGGEVKVFPDEPSIEETGITAKTNLNQPWFMKKCTL
jgi:hypothetical protein